MQNLEFYEWLEVNDQELTCIFAESGMDREYDFDLEDEQERLFENSSSTQKDWPGLVWTK